MITPFEPDTGNLPPGIHQATWDEVVARYGYTPRRRQLLAGLDVALAALRFAGCRRAYLDGSFVTSKRDPADYDACWELRDVDRARVDPILKTIDPERLAQKLKFGGEFFAIDSSAGRGSARMLSFFQRDKVSGEPKGIIAIDL